MPNALIYCRLKGNRGGGGCFIKIGKIKSVENIEGFDKCLLLRRTRFFLCNNSKLTAKWKNSFETGRYKSVNFLTFIFVTEPSIGKYCLLV